MTPDEVNAVPHEMFYFGCWWSAGHFLRDKRGAHVPSEAVPAEFQRGKLDGHAFNATPQALHHNLPQPLGVVRLQHITPAQGGPAWTVLSMWDRSVDSRGGSNASFLISGTYTIDEMWQIAERDFSFVVRRIRRHRDPADPL